jgi:Protein of unknown function (DUF3443)
LSHLVRALVAVVGGMALGAAAACGGSSPSSSGGGNTPPPIANTTTITVGPGPSSVNPSVNGAFVSVTICVPGSTTQCTTVPNVLLDTGSSGLRVLSTALGNLPLPNLTSGGATIASCIQYVDLSYNWGPVAQADVGIAGEVAASTSIQVITDPTSTFPAAPSSCSNGGTRADTVDSLSANGILGVSSYLYDCGSACAPGTTSNAGLYYSCSGTTCQVTTVAQTSQIQNVVARFATDNNGFSVTLPALPDAGLPITTGTLTFGIGTQSDNALGTAVVQTLDAYGNFTTTFNGASYSSSFIDTGSNAVFFLDSATTGLPGCTTSVGFYCPPTTQHLTATNKGANNQAQTVNFTVANLDTLPARNWVFDDVAGSSSFGDSQSGLPSLYFDWGLPFFFGRTVFVAIAGRTTPGGTGPYWAY